MATHVVQRPFSGAGTTHRADEVVDAGSWRNAKHLVSNRYLRALPEDAAPVACQCGRVWLDRKAASTCECGGQAAPPKPAGPANQKPQPAAKPPAKTSKGASK